MTHELKREGEGNGGGRKEREKGRREKGRIFQKEEGEREEGRGGSREREIKGGGEKGRGGREIEKRRVRENERMRAKTDCHTKCMYTLLKNIHGHEHARTQKNSNCQLSKKGTCVHGIQRMNVHTGRHILQ